VNAETATWHYGLIARYWNEFNVAEPAELAWYRAARRRGRHARRDCLTSCNAVASEAGVTPDPGERRRPSRYAEPVPTGGR